MLIQCPVLACSLLVASGFLQKPTLNFIDDVALPTLPVTAKECFDELGCFPVTRDFYDAVNRPLNVPVLPREKINTKFGVYTATEPDGCADIVAYNMTDSDLDGCTWAMGRPVNFIVYGFIDQTEEGHWTLELKDALLGTEDCNVVLVDWSKGNRIPYTQATANTRVVGAEIALFIRKLQAKFNLCLDDVHIFGHSLGSHIAGYAGRILDGRIGWITAMDAAAPYFSNMPASVSLDASDAQFVEAIHTSVCKRTWGAGLDEPFAHLDVYPNGGAEMPGCEFGESLVRNTSVTIPGTKIELDKGPCSHIIIGRYVSKLIEQRSRCKPVAYECPSYAHFEMGRCFNCGADGSRCAPMGLESRRYYAKFADAVHPVKMFFDTAKPEEICLNHYSLRIEMRRWLLENATERVPSVRVKNVWISLNGTDDSDSFEVKLSGTYLTAGATETALLKTSKHLGRIEKVTFKYESKDTELLEFAFIKVYPMNVAVPKAELEKLATTVRPSKPFKSGTKYTMLVGGGGSDDGGGEKCAE